MQQLCKGWAYDIAWANNYHALYSISSLVPRLPSPGNENRAKTEGSLVEFKSRAPLPLLHLSGRARIKERSPVSDL